MSFKKERRCSKFEHHEGVPSFDKTEDKEKGPKDNGDIVLANEVCRKIFLDYEALLFWGINEKVKIVLKLKI